MSNNNIQKHTKPLIIAFVQWFLTTVFQFDRLFYSYDTETALIYAVKVLFFLMLILIWEYIFFVKDKVATGDTIYKRGLHIFSFYCVIIMILLLILWPGTWAADDLNVLYCLEQYQWMPWQHILTSIYQMLLLQILPFPGGIILLQNVIISLCTAYIVVKLENTFLIFIHKNKYLDTFVKILPFLLPPVLMYQFSGYRIGIYIYLEAVLLTMWICAIKDNHIWTWKKVILFSFLCGIVASWRTESLLYVPFICVSLLFIIKQVLPFRKKFVCIALIIGCFTSINQVQSNASENNTYELMSILRPCTELVRVADKEADAELLTDLSRTLNLDVIYDNPERNGEHLYFGYGIVKQDYSKDDYRTCIKAFIKLCIKYPSVVIKERLNIFIWASGINSSTVSNVPSTYTLFDEAGENSLASRFQNAKWFANKAVFPTLRKNFIYILGVRNENGPTKLNKIVWNIFPPLLFLLYAWSKSIQKKEWHFFWILSAILIRVPIVVLTEPAGWFMYFLSFYFLGYIFLIFYIIHCLKPKENLING